MVTLSTVAQAPAAVYPFFARYGRILEKWVVRALATLFTVAGLLSIAGIRGLVAFAIVGGSAVGIWYGARRLPQATGALLSTLTWIGLIGSLAVAVGPVYAMVHTDFLVLYPISLLAVLAVTYVLRSPGVHRGWTVAVAHGTLMATFPLSVVWPSTTVSGTGFLAGTFGALAIVLWRDRKGTRVRPQRTGGRRWVTRMARGTAYGLISVVLFGSIAVANPIPADASPISWVSDKIGGAASGAMSDVVCSITRPDLGGQGIGTGPEGFLSNRNLGKVENRNREVPDFAKDATQFTRAATATDHSMDSYTLYEISGLRGVKWVNWQLNAEGEESCAMMPWISTMVGNLIMQGNVYILQATIALKEYAQAKNPIQGVYQNVSPVVSNLYNYFFIPMAGVMILIAAISMAVRAASAGGVRQGIQDAGLTAMVAMVAGVMYGGVAVASWAKPDGNGFYMIASLGDHIGGTLSSAIANTVFGTLDQQAQGLMCQAPQALPGAQATDSGHRFTSCVLAETLVYQPWAVGQFGKAGEEPITPPAEPNRFGNPIAREGAISRSGDEDGLPCYNNYRGCNDMRSYLLAQTGGPSIDRARADCLDGDDSFEALSSCDPTYAAAASLNKISGSDGNDPVGKSNLTPDEAAAALSAFSGSGTMPHVAKAISALFGTVIASIGIAAMSLIALWWHVMLLVAFILGPMRLVWAAFPGKSKMMKNWIDDIVYALLMATVYSVLCTLMVFMLGIMFTSSVATGFKLLWSVAVLVCMWVAMKKIEAAARPEGAAQVGAASTVQGATLGALSTAAVMSAAARRRGGSGRGKQAEGETDETASPARAQRRPNRPSPSRPNASGPGKTSPSGSGQSGSATKPGGGKAAAAAQAAEFLSRPVVQGVKRGAGRAAAATGAAVRNNPLVAGAEQLGGQVVGGVRTAGGRIVDAGRGVALRTYGGQIPSATRDRWLQQSDGNLAGAGSRARARAVRSAQTRQAHEQAMAGYREAMLGARNRND